MRKAKWNLLAYWVTPFLLLLHEDTDAQAKNTIAHFPGGNAEWIRFITNNTTVDLRKSGAPPGKYAVIIDFIVDTSGNVGDIRPESNPGYGALEMAMYIISKSPRWIPAQRNGKKIASPEQRTIAFVVTDKSLGPNSPNWPMRTDSLKREYYKNSLQTSYAKADSIISIENAFFIKMKTLFNNTISDFAANRKEILQQKKMELADVKQLVTADQYIRWLKMTGGYHVSRKAMSYKMSDKFR